MKKENPWAWVGVMMVLLWLYIIVAVGLYKWGYSEGQKKFEKTLDNVSSVR